MHAPPHPLFICYTMEVAGWLWCNDANLWWEGNSMEEGSNFKVALKQGLRKFSRWVKTTSLDNDLMSPDFDMNWIHLGSPNNSTSGSTGNLDKGCQTSTGKQLPHKWRTDPGLAALHLALSFVRLEMKIGMINPSKLVWGCGLCLNWGESMASRQNPCLTWCLSTWTWGFVAGFVQYLAMLLQHTTGEFEGANSTCTGLGN